MAILWQLRRLCGNDGIYLVLTRGTTDILKGFFVWKNATYIPVVSKKLTLLNSLPNKNCETFSGNFLIYHTTPKNLKIIHAWVSTGHFCKGCENYVAQELDVCFG